jgi:formylglycine-generating enzyme required for sulfatase activity
VSVPREGARPPKVGGPVDPAGNLYIVRKADDEFVGLLRAGEFVNLITSRQMGKTSLVYRAMAELGEEGYLFAYVDLAPLKNERDGPTYFRLLLEELARQLEIADHLADFWARHGGSVGGSAVMAFFREALSVLEGPVVVVLDEIDSTLESAKATFTDDLFTAIRSMYNARPREAVFKRLTFCLVGVATPNELIKARRTTPYNIGRTLWLTDFDADTDDLGPLRRSLSPDPAQAEALVARVMHWTGGQPYLTMWICDELRRQATLDPAAVDAFVEQRFGSLDGLGGDAHFDPTQRFLNERAGADGEVLNLYERILGGAREVDRPANLAHAHLKLSGLVKRDATGALVVRNRIYARLFDAAWVQKSRPVQALRRARRVGYVATAALLVALGGAVIYNQAFVRPLQEEQRARVALEAMRVTLQRDAQGRTTVGLPESGNASPADLVALLEHAARHLETVGQARGSAGLSLDLSLTSIESLAPLAALQSLRRLDVSDTAVEDLTPLGTLTSLEELDAFATKIRDLRPIIGLASLKRLDVSSNPRVADVTPLGNLGRLEDLNLSRTAVANLGPVAGLTALGRLRIDDLPPTAFATAAAAGRVVLGAPVLRALGGKASPGQVFRDCAQCPVMVVVPAGSFLMGSPQGEGDEDEYPQHNVTVQKPFGVGKYEITYDEWDACVAGGGCTEEQSDFGWGRRGRPAIAVNWNDAQQYIRWLSKRSGKLYRLLSEAEWEYAARAGTSTRYPWGDDPGTNRANFRGSGSRWSGKRTSPVGSFEPNAFGLHDLNGNVWEWVQDCWQDSYRGAPSDGSPWEAAKCGLRVVRGGSWLYAPVLARSADRDRFVPGVRIINLGFRVARTL